MLEFGDDGDQTCYQTSAGIDEVIVNGRQRNEQSTTIDLSLTEMKKINIKCLKKLEETTLVPAGVAKSIKNAVQTSALGK